MNLKQFAEKYSYSYNLLQGSVDSNRSLLLKEGIINIHKHKKNCKAVRISVTDEIRLTEYAEKNCKKNNHRWTIPTIICFINEANCKKCQFFQEWKRLELESLKSCKIKDYILANDYELKASEDIWNLKEKYKNDKKIADELMEKYDYQQRWMRM